MNRRNVRLVALREFRQVMALKSFWLTLLLLPAALAIGPLLGNKLQEKDPERIVIVDRSGGTVRAALTERLAIERDQTVLVELTRYVRRHDLGAADPQAVWARHDRLLSAPDVVAFRNAGGLEAALRKIERVKDPETPVFTPPPAAYQVIDAPPALAGEGEAFASRAAQIVADDKTPKADRIATVILVGEDYPADPTVRVWSGDRIRASLSQPLQDVVTTDLRQRLLTGSGLSPQAAAAIQTAAPRIAIDTPAPGGGGKEALLIRSVVPLALAYILMMGLTLSGSWLLQNSVEERSKKLLESLLACITPEELMAGKLLGSLAVGLLMLAVWIGAGAGAAFATHGAIADMIRPALAPISSPGAIATMIYFFIAGYVAISIVFVAIGALADSMSEAQGYLMPVLLAILLPVTFLIQAILAGSTGALIQIMTWVPIWTPFAMLARLGSGVSLVEVIGAGAFLAAFIAVEVIVLGRLFRASLLAQGQKPGLKLIIERLRATE